MADVSYVGAGAAAAPTSATNKLTVGWPASGLAVDQVAVLFVSASESGEDEFTTPTGWTFLGSQIYPHNTLRSGTYLAAYSWVLDSSSPDDVEVPVSTRNGAKTVVAGQLFVFASALRATARGRGITLAAGNAGIWAVKSNVASAGFAFDAGGLTTVDGFSDTSNKYPIVGYKVSSAGGYVLPETNVGEGDTSPNVRWLGIEIENRPGPSAPTPLAPASGSEVSSASDVTFRFLHNGFSPQTKFELRVRASGGTTWSYVKSDGSLTTSETEVTSAQSSIAVDSTEFTADTGYEWAVRTFDGNLWSNYCSTQTFTVSTPPTVTASSPSAAVTDDLTVTVGWSSVFSGARVQVAFRVTAETSAGLVLADSGTLLGAQESYTTAPLVGVTNGGAVTFTVYVTQTGGAVGSDTITQTVSWTPPTTPTITAAADDVGVLLTIGADVDTTLDVQRSDDSGTTWTDVAVGLAKRLSADEVLHDVLAPYGVAVTYRVRSSLLLDGMPLGTAWVTSSAATSTDTEFYLVDSLDPTNYTQANLQTDTDRRYVRGGSVTYPFGSLPVVDYGPFQGDAGSFSLLTSTQAEADAVHDLLVLPRPIWLRWPPDRDDGVLTDVAATYVAITPDPLAHERFAQWALAHRVWPVKWVEQPTS